MITSKKQILWIGGVQLKVAYGIPLMECSGHFTALPGATRRAKTKRGIVRALQNEPLREFFLLHGASACTRTGVMMLLMVCSFLLFQGCEGHQTGSLRETSESGRQFPLTDLRILESAYQNHQNNLPVTQQGKIIRILADDTEGVRHQRCIVELASGQSLLIAHNIDIAPRVPDLTTGTTLIFHGEYEWNKNGGTIHWTHHDPSGRHEAGWLAYQGNMYQ